MQTPVEQNGISLIEVMMALFIVSCMFAVALDFFLQQIKIYHHIEKHIEKIYAT